MSPTRPVVSSARRCAHPCRTVVTGTEVDETTETRRAVTGPREDSHPGAAEATSGHPFWHESIA
ncbi:MAG: hypothetical protein HY908_14425 [Myxococcales bacterium]|nr:hypothetical protein [Myxococcales bacterium]